MKKAFQTIRPIFRERGKINAEVTGRLSESLGGVRVVKGYHAEEREEKVFSLGVMRLLDNVTRSLTATSVMGLSASVLLGVVGSVIMFVGAKEILAGTLTIGGFFTYTLFMGFLIAPIMQIVQIGTQITEALAGLERTHEILIEPAEDSDPRRTVSLPAIKGDIDFEAVSFSYDGARTVLNDVSFHAAPGTVTALVGSSGSGKSTTIGLISAFYVPTRGKILVDGIDLSTVRLDSYRTQLGVVLQESFLFDGTIRENVAFSRPDASEEVVIRACRIARVDEFAESFGDKYNTIVGERGVKLSGGQRQRISIARAILAEPRILILDEATSSLDSESEQMIQQGLSYATPKVDVRAAVFREGRLLLVREREDGRWALPGGWADIGDPPSAAVVREVKEESGYDVKVRKLLALLDRNLHGHPPIPYHAYKLFFLCDLVGGNGQAGQETDAVDFFGHDNIPSLSLTRVTPAQVARLFEHFFHPEWPTQFD
jgi:ABC-type multidrug transport system fused ATPase/permease subunit/ADP-ribose pyrophosphatase YjhB (NUDIX family)